MIPVIDETLCTGCGGCIEICPPQAIEIREEKAFIVAEFCEECGFCAAHCPMNAITVPFPMSSETV